MWNEFSSTALIPAKYILITHFCWSKPHFSSERRANTTTEAEDQDNFDDNSIDSVEREKEWIRNSSKIFEKLMKNYDPSMAPFVPGMLWFLFLALKWHNTNWYPLLSLCRTNSFPGSSSMLTGKKRDPGNEVVGYNRVVSRETQQLSKEFKMADTWSPKTLGWVS